MMIFMTCFYFICVLVSLVSGCGYKIDDPSMTFQVSDDFDDDQYGVIQKEANRLCEATVGEDCPILTRHKADNKIIIDYNMDESSSGYAHFKYDAPDNIHAIYEHTKTVVTISIDFGSIDNLARIVAHEFGHAAGCMRHLEKGNIMYEGWPQVVEWTEADLACVAD